MPRLDGIEATRRIIAERPDAAVLVLTAFSDRAAHPRRARGGRVRLPAQGRRVRGRRRGHPRRRARRVPARPARRAHGARRARRSPTRWPASRQREREVLDAARRGPAEQADRPPPGDQREDRQVAPDADLPRARRHRPHAGRAVGRAPRTRTKVPLKRRPGRRVRLRGDAARLPRGARVALVDRGLRRRPVPTAALDLALGPRTAGSARRFTVDHAEPGAGLDARRRPRGPRRRGAGKGTRGPFWMDDYARRRPRDRSASTGPNGADLHGATRPFPRRN